MTATFSTNNLLRLVPSYTSGSHIPVWTDLQPYETTPTFPKLAANLRTDVIVVGAGIAGLSTAYELVERGKNVIVLDDGATVASGESGRTTCHLTSALDERYYNLVSLLGASNARKAFESHQWAIHRIHEIVNKHGIECDFTRINGYLISKASRLDTNYDRDELRKEFETCRDLGIPVEYRMAVGAPVPGKPSLTHENFNTVPGLNGTDVGDAVVFGGQAMCHPTKYLDALAKILTEDDGASSTTSTSQRRGTCQIFTHTHAQTMKGGKDEAYVLTSDGYRITAKDLVMATNMPETNLISMVDKLIPCRTYVIAAKIPSEAMPDCLIWDTYEPYHYVRTQNSAEPGLKWIIVGGEDHRVGQDLHEPVDERFRRLEAWTRERFPAMREVGYKWSGQIIEPIGSLASIGRNPGDYQNVYIVTGDSGNGMTHGILAGRLLAELIVNNYSDWESLYEPSRLSLKSAPSFIKHNLSVAKEYTRWLSSGDVPAIEDIPLCSGRVINHKAIYKDENGKTYEMSAVCPHAKSIIRWNSVENSWDCPAHGSRFDCIGRVMQGPAIRNLTPIHQDVRGLQALEE